MLYEKPTANLPLIFTAQSKKYYYCRDAVCEFVFNQGALPVNPFRLYGYFLSDRVDRDLVRQANNNLIRRCEALWVFGKTIADGVFYEIEYARKLNKPIRFFSIDSWADQIIPVDIHNLEFESEVYASAAMTRKELIVKISKLLVNHSESEI